MKRRLKILIILAGVAAAGLIAVGPIRLQIARKEADHFAEENAIDTAYESTAKIDSKKALLTEIWKLAVWEEDTRQALNTTYKCKDQDYSDLEEKIKNGV